MAKSKQLVRKPAKKSVRKPSKKPRTNFLTSSFLQDNLKKVFKRKGVKPVKKSVKKSVKPRKLARKNIALTKPGKSFNDLQKILSRIPVFTASESVKGGRPENSIRIVGGKLNKRFIIPFVGNKKIYF